MPTAIHLYSLRSCMFYNKKIRKIIILRSILYKKYCLIINIENYLYSNNITSIFCK